MEPLHQQPTHKQPGQSAQQAQTQAQAPHSGGNALSKLEDLINKFPRFPGDLSKFVNWLPWINLVFAIFMLPILLGIFGLQFFTLPFIAPYVQTGFTSSILFYDALAVLTFVLEAAALP